MTVAVKLGVQRAFLSPDFAAAVHHMTDEGDLTQAKERVNAVVTFAQALSDNAACNGHAHAPNDRNAVRPVADLAYNEAPRLLALFSKASFVQPKIFNNDDQ